LTVSKETCFLGPDGALTSAIMGEQSHVCSNHPNLLGPLAWPLLWILQSVFLHWWATNFISVYISNVSWCHGSIFVWLHSH